MAPILFRRQRAVTAGWRLDGEEKRPVKYRSLIRNNDCDQYGGNLTINCQGYLLRTESHSWPAWFAVSRFTDPSSRADWT